ncbi:MAG: NAD-dependent epimerase/dehydratase [Gemmatimonadetes bacterium]|jgi:nucleoside-diphosphate-sugar epimerase|nr:NAD-dependent epimerase/dehydratase [Gemmatimonadota bacterium]
MIAVVTGSTGFIGSHLVDALLARGATVRALVRPETPAAARDPRVPHWEADLLDDRSVRDSRVWEGATHVFHCAGITTGRTLAQFRAGNVFPTANVLAAIAARPTPRPRVVLLSSQAAAGPAPSADAPVRETDRPLPVEAYGRSKLQAEQAVARYRDVIGVTIIRPSAVYGPRDREFLRVFRQATGRLALHAVPQEHRFSLVHVRDLVRALLLAAEQPAAVDRTYFIGGEPPVTWRALYDAVAASAGAAPFQVQLPLAATRLAARAGDVVSMLTGRPTILNRNRAAMAASRYWVCDSTAARETLGWAPEVALQDGVREAYLWYVDVGWLRTPKPAASKGSIGEPTA